jgi:hypothetical protein
VLATHIHLIVEAKDRELLSRGMQGLVIRMARQLNKALGRTGRVSADRYFARALKTPREVRRAVWSLRVQQRATTSIRQGRGIARAHLRPVLERVDL